MTVTVANSSTNLLQNPSLESGVGQHADLLAARRLRDEHVHLDADERRPRGQLRREARRHEPHERRPQARDGRRTPALCAGGDSRTHVHRQRAGTSRRRLGAQVLRLLPQQRRHLDVLGAIDTPSRGIELDGNAPGRLRPSPRVRRDLSVGLGLMTVGSVTMDDFSLVDNAPPPDTTAPTSTIRCNGSEDVGCGTGWYERPRPGHAGSDGQPGRLGREGDPLHDRRLDSHGHQRHASIPARSPSRPRRRSSTARSTTPATSKRSRRRRSTIDTTAPQTTISCNGGSCGGTFTSSVSVTLAATDAASGVAGIRYTTDGSDPTATSGLAYLGAFSVVTTSTVKYRAFDQAGNAEAVKCQVVTIDGGAPSVSVTSPQSGAVLTGTVTLQADASDDVSVDHVDFLVDGQVVGTDSTSPYSVAWDTSTVGNGAHSITARAVDGGNNATTSAAVPVTVGSGPGDTTPPTTAIACNLTACASVYVSDVQVTLTATDNTGGSGVKEIRYTTDGTTPTATTGIVYSGAFTVSTTTTVKYRAVRQRRQRRGGQQPADPDRPDGSHRDRDEPHVGRDSQRRRRTERERERRRRRRPCRLPRRRANGRQRLQLAVQLQLELGPGPRRLAHDQGPRRRHRWATAGSRLTCP